MSGSSPAPAAEELGKRGLRPLRDWITDNTQKIPSVTSRNNSATRETRRDGIEVERKNCQKAHFTSPPIFFFLFLSIDRG